MKRVVFLEDLRESEIRPDSLYNKYKEILSSEVPDLFPDPSQFVKIDCPGCGGARAKKEFVKSGFQYCRCGRCGSLFVSPRPTSEMLRAFYRKSAAVSFWRDEVAQRTKESRYRQQSFPMAYWVLGIIDEYLPQAEVLLDYDSKYYDFLSIISENKKFARAISVFPDLPPQKGLLPDKVTVSADITKIKEKVDVFTAFEVIDRLFDPAEFIRQAYEACRSGGLLFLTSNTVSGFEYQVLGEKSPRLHPPDRLNLLSIEAINNRLTETGFEVIELSTPGRLDVEIVRNTLKSNPDIPVPDFLKYIFNNRDEGTWHSLQDFLQENRLSSYVRIAARKKPEVGG